MENITKNCEGFEELGKITKDEIYDITILMVTPEIAALYNLKDFDITMIKLEGINQPVLISIGYQPTQKEL